MRGWIALSVSTVIGTITRLYDEHKNNQDDVDTNWMLVPKLTTTATAVHCSRNINNEWNGLLCIKYIIWNYTLLVITTSDEFMKPENVHTYRRWVKCAQQTSYMQRWIQRFEEWEQEEDKNNAFINKLYIVNTFFTMELCRN